MVHNDVSLRHLCDKIVELATIYHFAHLLLDSSICVGNIPLHGSDMSETLGSIGIVPNTNIIVAKLTKQCSYE